MSVNIETIDFRAEEGDVLATRERARTLARVVADRVGDDAHLVLNFCGVDVASPAFLDEMLVTLHPITMGGDSGRLLAAIGLNEDVRDAFELVLERRKLLMTELSDDHVELLGGPDQLRETIDAAIDLGETFTAPELAERLAIKLPALHQRLKTLTDSGVLAREIDPDAERGVRHKYRQPLGDDMKDVVKTLQLAP